MHPSKLLGRKDRCCWCARVFDGEPQQFSFQLLGKDYHTFLCSDGCESDAKPALRYITRWLLLFYTGILVSVLVTISSIFWGDALAGVGLVLLGATALAFPFVTGETVKLLGLQKGMRLGRALGLGVLIAGVFMVVIGVN